MSLDLAFLVIDRATQTGDAFRVLQFLALKADDGDMVSVYSAKSIGRSTRIDERKVKKVLDALKATGYLIPRHVGQRHEDYFVARELLLQCPARERSVKRFAGRSAHLIGKSAQADLSVLLAERGAILRRFIDASDGERAEMLRSCNK